MPRLDEVSLSSLVVPDRLLNLPHRCHKVVHVLVLDKGGGPERRPVNNVLICEPRPRPIHELSDPRPIDGAAFVGNDDVEAVWSLRLFPLVCALLPDRGPLLLWDESRDDIEWREVWSCHRRQGFITRHMHVECSGCPEVLHVELEDTAGYPSNPSHHVGPRLFVLNPSSLAELRKCEPCRDDGDEEQKPVRQPSVRAQPGRKLRKKLNHRDSVISA